MVQPVAKVGVADAGGLDVAVGCAHSSGLDSASRSRAISGMVTLYIWLSFLRSSGGTNTRQQRRTRGLLAERPWPAAMPQAPGVGRLNIGLHRSLRHRGFEGLWDGRH